MTSGRRAQKRPPFSGKSLPQAGESLQDAAFDLLFGRIFGLGAMAITLGGVAVYEWIIRWMGRDVSPWLYTCGFLLMGGITIWQYLRHKLRVDRLLLGARGEREVGRMLEETRALGYLVFHDLPGEGFNVDHALIGPGGVFAIETKAVPSAPQPRRHGRLRRKARADRRPCPDRDPIAQAQASADHLRDLLKRTTGRDVFVRPVVLYPGWFVNPQPRGVHVWVLNPKNVAGFLRNEPAKLSGEDVALYMDRLTRDLTWP